MQKVFGLILAAGYSCRSSVYKPLAKLNDKYFIQNILLKMEKFCHKIIIVTGFRNELLKNKLEDCLPEKFLHNKIEFVFNSNFCKGMFTSIQTGVRHIQKLYTNNDLTLIHLVDQPYISEEVYKILILRAKDQKADVFLPSYKMKAGHPLIVNYKTIEQIASAPANLTLRAVLKKVKREYVEVCDKNILKDVDTIDS